MKIVGKLLFKIVRRIVFAILSITLTLMIVTEVMEVKQNAINSANTAVQQQVAPAAKNKILEGIDKLKAITFDKLFKDKEQKQGVLSPVILVRVVDGDTIVVAAENGTEYKVRLIGIDAPESVHADATKNNAFGTQASAYTSDLLAPFSTVYLQYDKESTDRYKRVLAYVWTSNQVDTNNETDIATHMINAKLVQDGYAVDKAYEPNTLYAKLFKELSSVARNNGIGLWQYPDYITLIND